MAQGTVSKWFRVIHVEENPVTGPTMNEITSKSFYDEMKITDLPIRT